MNTISKKWLRWNGKWLVKVDMVYCLILYGVGGKSGPRFLWSTIGFKGGAGRKGGTRNLKSLKNLRKWKTFTLECYMDLNLAIRKDCDEVQGQVMKSNLLDVLQGGESLLLGYFFFKISFHFKDIREWKKGHIRNSVNFSAAGEPFGTFLNSQAGFDKKPYFCQKYKTHQHTYFSF